MISMISSEKMHLTYYSFDSFLIFDIENKMKITARTSKVFITIHIGDMRIRKDIMTCFVNAAEPADFPFHFYIRKLEKGDIANLTFCIYVHYQIAFECYVTVRP